MPRREKYGLRHMGAFWYTITLIFAKKGFPMKKNIHPKYTEATITCACGNVIKTRSTVKAMSVNTCAACHPYFTGQQTLVDTEGRIDQFRKRYGNFIKK
jgi:large subunit ribosomal protein L31